MACCVALAMMIAYLLAFRDRIVKWRRVALVGLSIGLALAVLTLGLHHRLHSRHGTHGQPAEARE